MENNCPICFEDLQGKVKASPDICEHIFCLPCLEKWSKMGNYCPVDRKRYKKIYNIDSEIVIQIKPCKRKKKRDVYDFTTKCEICDKDDGPNVLLLCDCCDLAYHLHCLSPPLEKVPAGLWFCPTCVAIDERLKKKKGITKEVEAKTVNKKAKVKRKYNKRTKSKGEATSSQKLECDKCESALKICNDIISEFENINVDKSSQKAAFDSDVYILESSSGSVSNIHEPFYGKSSEYSQLSKTYSGSNIRKRRNKTSTSLSITEINKPLYKEPNLDTDNFCLKNNTSGDVDLLDRYLTESVQYGYMKPDALLSDDKVDLRETVRKKEIDLNSNCTDSYSLASVLYSENPSLEEFHGSNKPVTPSGIDELVPSSSFISDESLKGTCDNLNSEFLSKNTAEQSKEKLHFSVFDKIEGIDSSQKIYSKFISTVDTPFSSSTQHCSFCKDKIFDSQKQCRICKLKYFKKLVKRDKSIEHLKNSEKVVDYKFNEDAYVNSGFVILDNQTHIKKNRISIIEKRKRSLMRALEKIHNSKWKYVLTEN